MGREDAKLLERVFLILPKIKDGKARWQTVGDARKGYFCLPYVEYLELLCTPPS
jgi:hypothetical protein